jgi:uncharacterized protein DUF4936
VSRARRELYVYYRVATRDLPAALRIVEQAQHRLHVQCPTLFARVLRRADEPAIDDVTLMEIYRADEGIDDTLQRCIEEAAAALTPLLIGTRHTEAFVPLAGDA